MKSGILLHLIKTVMVFLSCSFRKRRRGSVYLASTLTSVQESPSSAVRSLTGKQEADFASKSSLEKRSSTETQKEVW